MKISRCANADESLISLRVFQLKKLFDQMQASLLNDTRYLAIAKNDRMFKPYTALRLCLESFKGGSIVKWLAFLFLDPAASCSLIGICSFFR